MKNKLFKELVFVAILPIGALISYSAINVLLEDGDAGLALFFAGSSLLATCFLIHLIHSRIFRPLEATISSLYSGNSEITHHPLVELSDAISSLLLNLELNHKTELEEKYKTLISETVTLKDINTELTQANELLERNFRLDGAIDESLIQLCSYHLKVIVGSTNGLITGNVTNSDPLIDEVRDAAESLLFINREIRDEAPSPTLENVETLQLVDDVLEMLAPISNSTNCAASLRINNTCPGRVILAVDEAKALIFQYLLHYFSLPDTATHVVVDVDFQKSNLIINVPGFLYPDLSSRRANLPWNSANSTSTHLAIPADAVTSLEEPGKGLKAIVVCQNHEQRECIIHRFEQYGVTITNDFKSRELHFCFVDDESSQAFKGIKPYLSPATHLILQSSNILYPRKNIHHIRTPLNHSELKRLLIELKTTTPVVRRYSILAVDDNESNLHLLELQLKELGHHVTTTTSGETAVKLYGNNHFDLVFLDIQMPGVDGLEATRLIHLIPGNRAPIIGLTAHATNEEKQLYLNAGMDQVLMKPIRINNLRSILDHHIDPNIKRGDGEPITPTQAVTLEVFDFDLAISRANNRAEIAAELLQLLISTLPADLDQINQASTNGNDEDYKSSIHRLNGAIRYCGVPRLANTIGHLETMVKISIDETSDQALEALNVEVAALLSWSRRNPDPFNLQLPLNSP